MSNTIHTKLKEFLCYTEIILKQDTYNTFNNNLQQLRSTEKH